MKSNKRAKSQNPVAIEQPDEQQFTDEDLPAGMLALEGVMADEDSISKLRDDIEQQSQRNTEFQSMVEDKLAGMDPSDEPPPDVAARLTQVEGQLSGLGDDGRVDAILLRVSSLEKKLAHGTPDPLINEIANRLGDLESSGGTGGPAFGDLESRVKRLQEEIEAKSADSDPRTEDVVLRIASLETSLKKSGSLDRIEELTSRLDEVAKLAEEQAVDPRIDEVTARLDELRTRVAEVAEDSAAAKQDKELAERLSAIERDVRALPSDSRFEEFLARLSMVEVNAARPAPDPRVDEITKRLGGLTARIEHPADLRGLDAVEERLSSVEDKLAEPPAADDRLDDLLARLSAVEEQPAAADTSALEEVTERLESLESQAAAESGDGDNSKLERKLEEIETAVRNSDADGRVDGILTRLADLETKTAGSTGGADSGDLYGRIEALESRGGEEGGRRKRSRSSRGRVGCPPEGDRKFGRRPGRGARRR